MDGRTGSFLRLVSDNEIEQIRSAAAAILCKSGFRIQNRTILECCEKRGLAVDYPKETVEVTPQLFEALEQCARRSSLTGDSSELVSRRTGPYVGSKEPAVIRRPVPAGYQLGRNITGIYDLTTGEKRLATIDDNRRMLKACHMLTEVTALAPLWTSADVPPIIEPIVGISECIRITDKPFSGIEVMMPGQLPYIQELHSLIEGGKEIRYTHSFASITKFTLDSRAAACAEEVWRLNGLQQWGSNSCPIAGMSAPVTIAGAAAVGMAEMVGGWIAGWAMNEDVTLCAVSVAGTVDMKTTRILFASPEAVLIDSVLYQVFNTLYGMSLHPEVSATYVDAKVPGFQAAHDKVFKNLAYLSFTGCHVGGHFGMLDSGSTICPAQLILDFDVNRSVEQLVRGLDVSRETIGLDVIDEVGVHGDFIGTEHTFRHFRDALWHPQMMDRTSFRDAKEETAREKQILQKAQEKYESAYRMYEPPRIAEATIRAADDVVKRAKEELPGG